MKTVFASCTKLFENQPSLIKKRDIVLHLSFHWFFFLSKIKKHTSTNILSSKNFHCFWSKFVEGSVSQEFWNSQNPTSSSACVKFSEQKADLIKPVKNTVRLIWYSFISIISNVFIIWASWQEQTFISQLLSGIQFSIRFD